MPFGGISSISYLGLSISGPEAKDMPLTVIGPMPVSGAMSLFTQGPEANNLTLWIGREVDASGTIPLFLTAPMSSGSPGTTLAQGETTLSVLGTSYDEINENTSLSISAPSIGSGIGISTLFVEVDAPSADGTVPVSGQMAISLEGNNPADVRQYKSDQTTLFIRVEEVQTSGMVLYLERPTVQSVPLSITSQISSGVLPVSISGVVSETSTATLYVDTPILKTMNTNISGYLE